MSQATPPVRGRGNNSPVNRDPQPCARCPRTTPLPRRGMCSACYEKQRRRKTVYGTWDCQRIDAAPTLEHLAALTTAGMSLRAIAAATGINRDIVRRLPARQFVLRKTADKILAIPVPRDITVIATGGHRIPVHGCRRRVQALVAAGWSMSELARRLDMVPRNLWASVQRDSITVMMHNRVKALFDELQMQPGPSVRARNIGAKHRWPLPFEWDEDDLDDPVGAPHHGRHSSASIRAERREQVAHLSCRGLSAPEIADRLGVSARQVTRDRRHQEAV